MGGVEEHCYARIETGNLQSWSKNRLGQACPPCPSTMSVPGGTISESKKSCLNEWEAIFSNQRTYRPSGADDV
jgi:hypothetical protein